MVFITFGRKEENPPFGKKRNVLTHNSIFMEISGILHDENNAYKLLNLTCDTLLLLRNDGTFEDIILRTAHPYISDTEKIIGTNIFDLLPEETTSEFRPEFENVVKNGVVSNKNYDLPAPDKMYYFKCIMQQYDSNHILCQYRDITQRSQMKKRLQQMNLRLQEIQRAAKIGQWKYNSDLGIIQYSGFADRRFLEGQIQEISLPDYCNSVHPEDIESLKNFILSEKKNNLVDYRVVRENIDYIHTKITDIYYENGHKILDGYGQNITDLINKRDQLEMITLAINNSNDSIYATYINGTMFFANKLCLAQNQIDPDINISDYKAYELLDNIQSKEIWDNFVESLLENGNILQYICKQPYQDYNIIASDCTSYIVKNWRGEDIIWSFRRDISEQLRYEEELVKAKEKAEESDRLKSAFLSNMSHEIRTPLNAIVGFSGIIADTDNAEERKAYYSIIEENNERLLQLIGEILDLSKIESGILKFTYSSVILKDLCNEQLIIQQVSNKQATLIFDNSPEDIVLISDKNRIIQVLSNLINNAIKFTPKGEIHFGYKSKEKEIEFHVTDTGIGIASDKIDSIFERFVKVDTYAPGTGLGLAICKGIIQKLGGEISVTSTLGLGTSFVFTLPYTQMEEEKQEYETKDYLNTPLEKNSAFTILVVEDIYSNFKLIKAIVGSLYKLVHATTGIEALEFYHKYHPDIILMDIKVPEIDGFELTRIIRRQSPNIPIIAVSAYAYETEKAKAIESGCNDFISKPVDKTTLLNSLKKYLDEVKKTTES